MILLILFYLHCYLIYWFIVTIMQLFLYVALGYKLILYFFEKVFGVKPHSIHSEFSAPSMYKITYIG